MVVTGTCEASCSVLELSYLSKRPIENVQAVLDTWNSAHDGEELYYDSFAYVLFGDIIKKTGWEGELTNNGTKLANFIKENDLGSLTSPRRKKNPNTGNTVKVWLWSPDMTTIRKIV